MISIQKTLFFAVASSLLFLGCGDQRNASTGSDSPKAPKEILSEPDALKKAAEGGDAKAQLDLGWRFNNGDGVEKNQTSAFEWWMKSAENGNVEAMFLVGTALSEGRGIAEDGNKGKLWIKKAAEAGNATAQYEYAKSFGITNRFTMILGKKNEEQEYARQYVEWLDKAAKQNHKEAKYALGMTYLQGAKENWWDGGGKTLIDSDPESGEQLLKDSADAGYWQAQWAMATLYQTGFGKIKSRKEESNKYWNLLAGQSDPEIQRRIGDLYHWPDKQYYKAGKNKYQGRELSFDDTNKVAIEWYSKAADKEDIYALYSLGTMFRDGIGVFKDEQQSFEFFKRSAEKGHYGSMRELAFAYLAGKGTVKDYAESHKWLLKAADEEGSPIYSEVHKVRNALGALYEFGWGVEKDIILAYAWYNIAASGGFDKAKQNLARVEKSINPEDLRNAQALSREWKPGKNLVRSEGSQTAISEANDVSGMGGTSSKSLKLASVGTGFFVSQNGNVLTNNHVIEGCSEIRVPAENTVGKLVVVDQANDLALVKLEVTGKASVQFPNSDDLKQGEEVFVFGFPLDGFLPSSGNITPGIISALAGPGNNSSLVQMTAPVQPGNSGGPLMNKKGKVVGVVVGKANAIKIAKVTGDIPQNINFAIAPRTVRSFLDANRIEYQKKGDTFSFDKDSVAIADEARKASLKIECWK
jgi:uncharacterized protein